MSPCIFFQPRLTVNVSNLLPLGATGQFLSRLKCAKFHLMPDTDRRYSSSR